VDVHDEERVVLRACCQSLLSRTSHGGPREGAVVRKVVVPCERMEERSQTVIAVNWTEVR